MVFFRSYKNTNLFLYPWCYLNHSYGLKRLLIDGSKKETALQKKVHLRHCGLAGLVHLNKWLSFGMEMMVRFDFLDLSLDVLGVEVR